MRACSYIICMAEYILYGAIHTWAGLAVAGIGLKAVSYTHFASILCSDQVLTTSCMDSSITGDRALCPVAPIGPLTVN